MTRAIPAVHAGAGPIPNRAGIGLRFPHDATFPGSRPAAAWVEVHTENYLAGPALAVLETVRRDYPISLHGVGLSLGSASGIDRRHLARVAALAGRIEPALVSEHLAWGAVDGAFLADLLPLPLTEESLDAVGRNIELVQETLRRPILIENPSTYLQFGHSTIPEPEFLSALARRTGCGLICDVNNIYVSCTNHGWNAEHYLSALSPEAVGEYHLAGHSPAEGVAETLLLDTHDRRVDAVVWSLFATALRIIGPRPALIEWDAGIPELAVLLNEAALADRLLARHGQGARDARAP